MAQVDFDNLKTNSNNSNLPKGEDISFGLKDGQRALVRFLHDSTSTFDVVSTHVVKVPETKYGRRIECLRKDDEQPLADCPLCARGEKLEYRFYVHMLVYFTEPDGTVTVKPMVWDRPLGFAYELKEKLIAYGPLTQSLFTIKRQGSGMNDTKYMIDYAIPQAYPPELYPYDPNLFSETIKYPHLYLSKKTAAEIDEYLQTGRFPVRENNNNNNYQAAQPTPVAPVAPTPAAPMSDPLPQTFGQPAQTYAQPTPVAPAAPQYTPPQGFAPAAPQFVPGTAAPQTFNPAPPTGGTPPWQAPDGVIRQY